MNTQSDDKRIRDDAYRKAYRDWVAKLPRKERRRLERQGLLEPAVDPLHIGKGEDISAMPIADATTLPHDGMSGDDGDGGADRYAGRDKLDTVAGGGEVANAAAPDYDRVWEVLRRLLGELLSTPNAQLSLECLALVSGVGFMGDSMTAIAKRHGVTRAAVSKRCIQLTEQLDMLPSRAMRSLTARATYRTAQTKHYELRERFDHRQRNCPRN
jgi:hypothetical protein